MLVRSTVNFDTISTLPKDRCTNTFWFAVSGNYADALQPITDALTEFYSDVFTTYGQGNWCGNNGTQNNFVSHVNWDEPAPRVATDIYMVGSAWNYSATVIPTEVACVLSFHAAPLSGASQARRRGRIYIPGLVSAMFQQTPTAWYPEFTTTFLNQIALAAIELQSTLEALGIVWVVYSRVNDNDVPVVAGWLDDSPDTVRRRSVNAVARLPWEIA